MNSADDTRATVTEFLDRVAAGDHDRVAELFAEPVDWQLDWPDGGHPEVPWVRPRSTRADVADHFRALAEHHVPEKNATSVSTLVVEGKEAVLLGHLRQTVRATGRPYTAMFALHLTVENGLITRYHIYEDSLTVADALAGATGPAGRAAP